MTENQKLREALQKAKDALSLALSDVDWRKDSPTQPVIHKAYNCAHQALALPTAEQVDDINVAESFTSVTKTAAPVGEREAFEAWLGITPSGAAHDFGWAAWKARAALSAGDAVDARQRAVHSSISRALQEAGIRNEVLVGMCIEVGLETYDAAMRKGQL